MKSWVRVAVGTALTVGVVWTLVELDPAAKWRAGRAWWS